MGFKSPSDTETGLSRTPGLCKNSFATAWRCRERRQLGPRAVGGVRVTAGWVFAVAGERRAGRKVQSGGGVLLVVTGFAWTVRGRK